jgi:hypothetical protein
MSNRVTIEQTNTGWHVVVTDADSITIDTDGKNVNVKVEPDENEDGAPLVVNLA